MTTDRYTARNRGYRAYRAYPDAEDFDTFVAAALEATEPVRDRTEPKVVTGEARWFEPLPADIAHWQAAPFDWDEASR